MKLILFFLTTTVLSQDESLISWLAACPGCDCCAASLDCDECCEEQLPYLRCPEAIDKCADIECCTGLPTPPECCANVRCAGPGFGGCTTKEFLFNPVEYCCTNQFVRFDPCCAAISCPVYDPKPVICSTQKHGHPSCGFRGMGVRYFYIDGSILGGGSCQLRFDCKGEGYDTIKQCEQACL
eukprot:TRINITY_DN12277_c1_g1_i3.p2 TRINITY_DN12277_c1_g1~~TRINITY_DN12277_c1_g1_i3.p2  ORF type:complete len:201 (-),score=2.86 TRINITY_DN12277_c1_g1_i3:259-804(-)